MTPNTPVPNSENGQPQVFTSTDISVNGHHIDGMNQLPPELRDKIQAAMSKLQGNPGLLNLVSSMSELAKSATQNGIGVTHTKKYSPEQLKALMAKGMSLEKQVVAQMGDAVPNSVASMGSTPAAASFENPVRPITRNISTPSSTYNPMVKGDGLRKAIMLIAAVLIIGYLVVKFGFNGRSPF